MNEAALKAPGALALPLARQVDELCCRFEDAWQAGQRPRIEDYLADLAEPVRDVLLRELSALEIIYRRRVGDSPQAEEYQIRFPSLEIAPLASLLAAPPTVDVEPAAAGVAARTDLPASHAFAAEMPRQLGRYRVVKLLGEGGFGRVYLAQDDKLNRPVAVKVPHWQLVAGSDDAEAYLTEAQIVANLDHPNIVPVHDVGSTEDCPCFLVSKFIEGTNLAKKIRDDRPSFGEAAELVATVALALHDAHGKGLVHRDIKPGNILLDKSGKPFVVDFGLALREQDIGKGPRYAGTPPYMSPEQARGEGHRVDGRSDIFSLGVVFYELLTGRRPFKGHSEEELLEQITNLEPRPPRQYDDRIPKELERICLQALAKRAVERYSTAKDMADDLRQFLVQQAVPVGKGAGSASAAAVGQSSSPAVGVSPFGASSTTATTPASDNPPLKVVPKGLRSFDAHDADFFLELLPGPRDRDGLPASIRFWKSRIEETDPDNTFAVGLIYGPSGCGKSSLVQAGLLPRLSDEVLAVYIEATANETESRLLNGLRKRFSSLPVHLGLKETLAALRHGQSLPAGKKVLLMLDQFEQWLHAKKEEENTELVQALRQCDGGRVQCLVLVRDDFWMAATRFMRALEIRLLAGQNSAALDLFDLDHARKVLAAFGYAFGKSPEKSPSKEQKDFLKQAVAGLAEEGKVICVRLALFAEMMKGKPWTPASLKAVGGTEGVGVAFLEETFSAATAPPEHRYHQKAARAVLKALLPETGTDIKGHMRSYAQLLEASGYASRPRDFEELIGILDRELRLLTPTDPEGTEQASGGRQPPDDSLDQGADAPRSPKRFYQLTHDYLVPSLRNWLTRKQKETRRGRAELLLADRAAVWNARPENRQLPSLFQWFQLRWLTQRKNWTPAQRKMMRKATGYHALRGVLLAALLTLIGWSGYEVHGWLQAHALRDRLFDANTHEVPTIVQDMVSYRPWLDPLLQDAYAQAGKDNNRRKQLHASLALLPVDASQVKYLSGRLLDAEPSEVPVLRDALAHYKEELVDQLWAVAEWPQKGKESQRLRATAALATYDPDSQRWAKVQEAVANDLVRVPAVYLADWLESFRSVRAQLRTPLAAIFREAGRRDAERSLATDILADYAADQPQVLADLLMDADEKQFAVLYPKFKEQAEQGLPVLKSEIDLKLPSDAQDDAKEKLAKRQANAAVALLKMNQAGKVWPLLKHRSDPRARSYLIHRLAPLRADAGAIIQRLDEEPDITIRRALLLSLGEFGEQELPQETRRGMLPKLQDIYRTASDPGLHASAEWLLRQWQQESWLRQINDEWAKDKEQRQKRLQGIWQLLTKDKEKTPPQWYVNGQGQTLVVIPGPVEFVMGSPPREEGRYDNESQHRKRIGRTFAIAATPITVGEYRHFYKSHHSSSPSDERYAPTAECPVVYTSWYEAAAYCNWLSKQEGIAKNQSCYETDQQGRVTKLKENYLSLTGYRLPTEAEWEYACRAGAVTSRYYGESEELLGKYGWYLQNAKERTWPVGSKRPNDLGLFDVHGNIWNWCQERRRSYPQGKGGKVYEDLEDILSISIQDIRVFRGGSFYNTAGDVRSANRSGNVPTFGENVIGFRCGRTLAP